MIVKLLIEHYLGFLSFKRGFRGSAESTLVKMSNCWKSHAAAQIFVHLPRLQCSPLEIGTCCQTYSDDLTILWKYRRRMGSWWCSNSCS